jgi:hypothetical protein
MDMDKKERLIRVILDAVPMNEGERQRQIYNYMNNGWGVQQVFRIHETVIQPQYLDQVKEALKRNDIL